MSDFSNNVKENIKRLETSLNVERNFDILQREVIIAGRKAGFFLLGKIWLRSLCSSFIR